MRHTSLIVAAGALALMAGCSSTDSSLKTEPDAETPSSSAATTPAATKGATTTAPNPVASKPVATKAPNTGVGASFTIEGNGEPPAKIKVTLLKIVDPAKSTDDFSSPGAGKRFVAIQFSILNVGEGVYEDSPSNGSNVTDAEGQQFDTTFAEAGGVQFASLLKLAPGKTSKGFLTYEVPKAAKIVSVQFGTDSGFGETAEWTIGK